MPRYLTVALMLAAAGLLMAACGGSSSPSVADLSSPAALSKCMRAHGVPGFPDPIFPSSGGVAIRIGGPGRSSVAGVRESAGRVRRTLTRGSGA